MGEEDSAATYTCILLSVMTCCSRTRSSFKAERSGSAEPPKDYKIKPRKSASLTAEYKAAAAKSSTQSPPVTLTSPATPRY